MTGTRKNPSSSNIENSRRSSHSLACELFLHRDTITAHYIENFEYTSLDTGYVRDNLSTKSLATAQRALAVAVQSFD